VVLHLLLCVFDDGALFLQNKVKNDAQQKNNWVFDKFSTKLIGIRYKI
jgi:hypothetical protein